MVRKNDPAPKWVAEKIIEDRRAGKFLHDIAAHWRVHISVVTDILDVYARTGQAREPQPGRGKTDDPRWIFAGPRGPGKEVLAIVRIYSKAIYPHALKSFQLRVSLNPIVMSPLLHFLCCLQETPHRMRDGRLELRRALTSSLLHGLQPLAGGRGADLFVSLCLTNSHLRRIR